MIISLCEHCKKREAVCLGAYEDAETLTRACGDCCAHGNEDGHCEPIGFDSWAEWYEAIDEEEEKT